MAAKLTSCGLNPMAHTTERSEILNQTPQVIKPCSPLEQTSTDIGCKILGYLNSFRDIIQVTNTSKKMQINFSKAAKQMSPPKNITDDQLSLLVKKYPNLISLGSNSPQLAA